MRKNYDSHYRSIIKTISWRILATATTIGIVYLFSKEILLSLGIGVVEMISKMLFYYLHERVWNLLSFGICRNPFYGYSMREDIDSEDHETI